MDREKTKNKKSGLEFVTIKRGNMTKVKERKINPNTGEVEKKLVRITRNKKSGEQVGKVKSYQKFSDGTSRKYKTKSNIDVYNTVKSSSKLKEKGIDDRGIKYVKRTRTKI